MYAVSFALVAVAGLGFGYLAAVFAILMPLENHPFRSDWLFEHERFDYIALLISGWINPVFLLTVILAILRRSRRTVAVLRILVILMIPFCWVVFYENPKFYPREGHFFWIFGMVLALFSI